jgi:hypothetical protein
MVEEAPVHGEWSNSFMIWANMLREAQEEDFKVTFSLIHAILTPIKRHFNAILSF